MPRKRILSGAVAPALCAFTAALAGTSLTKPPVAVAEDQLASDRALEQIERAWIEHETSTHSVFVEYSGRYTVTKGAYFDGTEHPGKNVKQVTLPAQDQTFDVSFSLATEANNMRVTSHFLIATQNGTLEYQDEKWVAGDSGYRSLARSDSEDHSSGFISKREPKQGSILRPQTVFMMYTFRPFSHEASIFRQFRDRYQVMEGTADIAGHSCIGVEEVRPARESGVTSFWVDDDGTYALRRLIRSFSGVPFQQIDVLESGVDSMAWVPRKWRVTALKQDGSVETILESTVTTMRLNQPLGSETFELGFPAGTWVNDADEDLTYIIRPDGTRRIVTREDLLSGARYQELYTSETGTDSRGRRAPGPWSFVVFGGVVVLAVGVSLARRYWRTRRNHES